MAIGVRQASAADAAAISILSREIQALHASALPWRFKPAGANTLPPATVAAFLAQPENLTFIAEIDAETVGYAYAEVVRRTESPLIHAHEMVYLHHIGVQAGQRRKGIGTELINALRAAGRSRGIGMLAVDIWSFNDEARNFFRRQGFETYNERMWLR